MANHTNSIHLSKNEYNNLFTSRWLASKRGFKIEKVGEFYKLTADWPERLWNQLEEQLSAMFEQD